MKLAPYVDDLHRHLAVAVEAGGDDARRLAERLIAPLDAAARLVLLEALSAGAAAVAPEQAVTVRVSRAASDPATRRCGRRGMRRRGAARVVIGCAFRRWSGRCRPGCAVHR